MWHINPGCQPESAPMNLILSQPTTATSPKSTFKVCEGGGNYYGFPPPKMDMFQSLSRKSNKYIHTQCLGRGFRSDVRFRIWPLFVTQNGIFDNFSYCMSKMMKEKQNTFWIIIPFTLVEFYQICSYKSFTFWIRIRFWIQILTTFCNLKRYFMRIVVDFE